jgi:hypothetical protein
VKKSIATAVAALPTAAALIDAALAAHVAETCVIKRRRGVIAAL